MKLSGVIVFVRSYPERVVLGFCVIILLVVLAGHLLGGGENVLILDLDKQVAVLADMLKVNSPVVPEKIGYLGKVKSAWEGVQRPMDGKDWLMYRQPIVAVKFETAIKIVETKTVNLPPIAKEPQVDARIPDQVVLNWDGNISSTALVKSYRIYRRAAGDKDFSVIAEVSTANASGTGFSHVDKGVNSEREYIYYFTALSDDNASAREESEPSIEVKVATNRDYDIKFTMVDLERNRVYTQVDKYLNGKWESHQWFVIKGDKIDKGDFVTGCTLTDFQEELAGKTVGGVVIEKKTFRVFYIDKKGREYSFLIPPK